MTSCSVLISGAGIAGPTLAYWLARHGFRPTLVELSPGLRSSGNPVDVVGPAVPVVEAMGILPRLREAATTATAVSVLNPAGRQVARVAMSATRRAASRWEVELPRGDLAAVLCAAARDEAEFLFDDTIVALHQDRFGVEVTFEHATPRRFDLVVGADGLHSVVRRLAFGPEDNFVRHTGIYVATVPFGEAVDHPHDVLIYNTPGKLVAIHPGRGQAGAAFIFRSRTIGSFDHRDPDLPKRLVPEAYAGVGWRVPQLLKRLQDTDDIYFDAVSQVRLPSWSQGRVALVGDAASCVSLFGDGSSLAIAGAHTLAAAVAAAPADPVAAFGRYEAAHRTLVDPKQRYLSLAAALLVPKTRLGIAARNLAARVLSSRRSGGSGSGHPSRATG